MRFWKYALQKGFVDAFRLTVLAQEASRGAWARVWRRAQEWLRMWDARTRGIVR